MGFKNYIKEVWRDVLHDECGQWEVGLPYWLPGKVSPFTTGANPRATGRSYRATRKPYTPTLSTVSSTLTPAQVYGTSTPTRTSQARDAGMPIHIADYVGSAQRRQPDTVADTVADTVEDVYSDDVPHTSSVSRGGGGGGGGGGDGDWLADIEIEVPDFTWNPTEEQLRGWQAEAAKRAALIYDPQLEEVARGLERFRGLIDEERPRVERIHDEQNLRMANVIENTLRQAIVEDAIRRGATESGELPRQMAMAGRTEVEQRADIERQRGDALEQLRNALMQQEQEAADARKQIERLRGKKQEVRYADLERQARSRQLEELQTGFQGELDVVGLQNAVAAAQAQAEYNQAVLAAQREQQAWERRFADKQFGYQQAQTAWQRQQAARIDPFKAFEQEQAQTRWQWEQEDRKRTQEAIAQAIELQNNPLGIEGGSLYTGGTPVSGSYMLR